MKNILLSDINLSLDFSNLSFFTKKGLYSHLSEKFSFEEKPFSNRIIILKYFKRRKKNQELCNIFDKYGNSGIIVSEEKTLMVFEIERMHLYLECEIDIKNKKIDIYFDYDAIDFYKYRNSLTLTGIDYILLNPLFLAEESLLLHSSSVVVEGKAYMFVGHSGYGKSTIYNLIRENIPDAIALCDDRNLLSMREDFPYLSSFWREINDVRLFKNKTFPLSKVFFIEKSEENYMKKIEIPTAKTKLFNSFFRFSGQNKNFIDDSTKFLFNFTSVFNNFYNLEFTKDQNFVDYFSNEIKK